MSPNLFIIQLKINLMVYMKNIQLLLMIKAIIILYHKILTKLKIISNINNLFYLYYKH